MQGQSRHEVTLQHSRLGTAWGAAPCAPQPLGTGEFLGSDPTVPVPHGTGLVPAPGSGAVPSCRALYSCFANKGSNASLPGLGAPHSFGGLGQCCNSTNQTLGCWCGAEETTSPKAPGPFWGHRGLQGAKPASSTAQVGARGTPLSAGPLLVPNLPSPCRCARRTWGATPPPWISPRPSLMPWRCSGLIPAPADSNKVASGVTVWCPSARAGCW